MEGAVAMVRAKQGGRMTLSEQAYKQIKEAICQGKITSGDILSENQLAQDLGMSRTPVREALRALASEDWLEIKNGVGAYVKPLSSKDIQDLYEVRRLLEVQAAKTSVYRITDGEIDGLEARFRQLLEQTGSGGAGADPKAFSQLDWELHELIVERCQNNYIKSIMRNNTANMKCYQALSFEALHDLRESTRQHLNILVLLRRRDREGLTAALDKHLEWAAGFLNSSR